MPSTHVAYEKVITGGSFSLPDPGTRHVFSLTPTLGRALKRVIVRGDRIQGKNSGLTAAVVEPVVLTWEVSINDGDFTPSHVRFHKSFTLPMWTTAFFADAVDVYNVWWSGGAQDWGFDQEILVGSPTDPGGPEVFLGLTANTPSDTANYSGLIGCDVDIMAIYAYPP